LICIPASIMKISTSCFEGCENLASIFVPVGSQLSKEVILALSA
jgi:hypothetical protein